MCRFPVEIKKIIIRYRQKYFSFLFDQNTCLLLKDMVFTGIKIVGSGVIWKKERRRKKVTHDAKSVLK